jgi:hypothetical protein
VPLRVRGDTEPAGTPTATPSLRPALDSCMGYPCAHRPMRSRLLTPRSFGKGRGSVGRIAGTYLAADICGMAKKPELPKPIGWNIYKIGVNAIRLGTVEAPDAATAIEKPATGFNVRGHRLIGRSLSNGLSQVI